MSNSRNNDTASRSSFDAYMEEARKIPLLNAEQEISLARQAQQGGAAATAARDKLITSNLRFVVSIAWKQVRDTISLEDLVQEGNLGLFKAVEKFDPDKGFRFLTYARWWIQQGIRTFLDENGYAVRVPTHSSQDISKMNRVVNGLQQRGEEVTDEAVARAMEVSVERVRELAEWSRHPISLHTPVFDGEGELGDRIADESSLTPEAAAMENDRQVKTSGALSKLTEKERHVITLRFGLDGQGERTLEEVGQIYGVTRERIRQIEAKALEKLGAGTSGRMLRSLL